MLYFYLLKVYDFVIMLTTIPSFLVKKTFDQVINNLQTDFRALKAWFYDNFLVLNPKKCLNSKTYHFWTLGNGNNFCDISCDDIIIKNCLLEKILGLTTLAITSLIYVKPQIKK